MTPSDHKKFGIALLALGEAFDAPVTETRVDAYFAALSDIDWPSLEVAMQQALKALRWFPKPVELRELAIGVPADDAEHAWGLLLDEARRVGSYGTPNLPAVVMDAVRAVWGSWQRFCLIEVVGPEGIGNRKQFVSAYATYARKAVQGARALTHAESVAALASVRARMLPQGERL